MTFDVTIEQSELDAMGLRIERDLNLVKSDVQLAMGVAFFDIVKGNFGFLGIDRPDEWAPLSPAYAKKVKRTYATLEVTGKMMNAVKLDNNDFDASHVSLSNDDVAYATAHHYGTSKLPVRRVFPIDSQGEVMPYTAGEVTNAAIAALQIALR